jgi:hypothetical protein
MWLNLFMQVMLPIALLVAAGGVWARLRGAAASTLRSDLNRLTLYLFAPALMFAVVARTPLDRQLLSVPLLVALGVLLTGTLLYGLLYHGPLGRGLKRRTRAALLLAGMFPNVFYLGFPLVTFLYGTEGGRYPAFADVLATTPLLWTAGVWIATRLGQERDQAHAPLWRVLVRLPPVWAFVLGLTANQFGLAWEPLLRATAFIGQATIPVMLFVLGLSIPWARLRVTPPIAAVCAVKLLVMPLLVWALAALLFDPLHEAQRAAVIEAALPTMLFAVLMADRFNLDTEAAGLMIGVSTLTFWLLAPWWLLAFA